MRRTIVLPVVVALGLLLSVPAEAQICGDVNMSGRIDLADLSYLIGYMTQGLPSTPTMDMDGRTGVTLGDLLELTDYLFLRDSTFNCTLSQTYSFASSPNDTIFIPHFLNVPPGLTTVKLPVRLSLQPGSRGVLFFLRGGEGDAGFSLVEVEESNHKGDYDLWGGTSEVGSNIFMIWRKMTADSLAGNRQHFNLVYGGSGSGGSIVPESFDRDNLVRLSVERNGDLFVPTVVYYDYAGQLPPDTLKLSVSSLAFTAAAGRETNDTLAVSFTSTGSNITFDLSATQPWLKPLGVSGTLTTPVTINVTVDASSTPEGNYTDALTITNTTSPLGVVAPQTAIPVTLAVGPPINYPPGDVTCDGVLDLQDLSLIIARLVGGHGPIQPCY